MKKFLSKHKNIFFAFIIIVLFILLVGLVAFFMQKDKREFENKSSDISLVSTNDNLNRSWSIDNNGDLVGNNFISNNVFYNDVRFWGSNNLFNTRNYDNLLTGNTYTFSFNISNVVYDSGYGVDNTFLIITLSNNVNVTNQNCLNQFVVSSGQTYRAFFTFVYDTDFTISLWGPGNHTDGNHGSATWNYFCLIEGTSTVYEPYGVWYSSDNYNSVVNDYNNLNNDVIKFNNYGMLAYLDYMEITIGNDNYYFNDNEDTEMSFDYCVSQGFIQSGGLLNLSYFTGSSVNPNYYTIGAYLSFDYDKIFVSQFNLNFDSSVVASVDVDFYGFSYNTPIPTSDSSYSIFSSDLLNLASENQSNSSLASVSINFNSAESVGLVNFNSVSAVSFNNGYQKGYSTASNIINSEYLPQIDTLNTTILDLENQLNTLTDNYNTLNTNFSNLQAQYQELLGATEYSMSELFWSISAVPFGVLTSAFNVDVLGVNLRGIITGLFTSLLLIWLIKKFL